MQTEQERMEIIANIYQENYAYLYRCLARLTKDNQLVEDIIQDVFAKLIKKSELVLDLRYVRSFLITSARNQLIDYHRKLKPALYGDEAWVGHITDHESYEKKLELSELIHSALNKLPAHHRLVIVAKDYYGYSCQEIAELTGSSCGSVKTRIFRARKEFIQQYRKVEGGSIRSARKAM